LSFGGIPLRPSTVSPLPLTPDHRLSSLQFSGMIGALAFQLGGVLSTQFPLYRT
jgi:hypothetical protein